ncbi:hypothetical protein PMAYCL1PPCAC_32643, partial [Pristionchus mayeri]
SLQMHYGAVPEVFVVGEPSMLGGEFREDERTIDKLENPNYDPNAAMRHPPSGPPGMMMQQQPGPASLQQLQQHHQLMGGPSPGGQPGQPPGAPPQMMMGGPHGAMGPPMIPQQQLQQLQQQQGAPTPPGAMPNGLQQPPAVLAPDRTRGSRDGWFILRPFAGYEYLAQWPRQPTNHLLA